MATRSLDEQAIFEVARKIDPGEAREAYLLQVCGEDAAIKRRVRALLKAYQESANFLESPAASLAAALDEPMREGPGTVIGPYKLLEQIGEGGMGLVFMAEQTQPVRRRVALKVIKPGMDTRHVVARFEAERQALALMDHPNIAKIHDAGTTGSGRPYFVMELVRGVPITEFCDQRCFTARQRLELFVTVCQAVQHAHQKGIIHRDLKPSNVLVTLHDTIAVPKIIDFGVAKATTQPLTEQTLFTHFSQMIGTPLYMSPEQAEMNGLDVDTRSDVYALGVLLYELLTGTTPFESQAMKKVGLDEMRRMIREVEAPTPSQRLSTLNAQVCETISERRGVDSRRLGQVLRGELDWIVMKALEKDRNRRYESASAFAADVQRYLNDEAVSACPPSAGYKLRKFARKKKKLLATAATFCLLLTAGVVVSTWQAVRAHQSELKASEAQFLAEERFQLAKEAVDKYLNEVTETPELKNANLLQLRKKLLETALPFYQKLAERTPDDREGKAASGAAYLRLGQIRSDLGDHAAAITHFEQARNSFAELAEQHTDNPTFRQKLARSYGHLALQMRETGRPEVAEANYRAAVIVNEKLVDDFPADAEYRHDLASTYDDLGLHIWFVGRAADAEASARAALSVRQKLVDDFPLNADYQNELAETLLNLSARRLEGFQDAAGAKALLDQGCRHHEAAMTLNPRQPAYREFFAENRRWLSKALLGMGDFEGLHGIVRMIQFIKPNAMICVDGGEEAVSVAQSGLVVRRRLAEEFPSVVHYRLWLAISYEHLGDVLLDAAQNADATYAHSLAIYRRLAETYPTIPEYRSHLASFLTHASVNQLVKARRFAEAEAACRDAVAIQEGLVDEFPQGAVFHAELALSLSALARLRLLDNAPAEARRLAERSRTRMEAAYRNEPNHPWYRRYYSVCLATVGAVAAATGDGKVVAELIDRLKSGLSEPILDRYNAACVAASYAKYLARNAKLPQAQRQKMAGDSCDQAMDLLRQTVQAGFKNAAFIKTDSDLELLQDREDFQKLITELEVRRRKNKP